MKQNYQLSQKVTYSYFLEAHLKIAQAQSVDILTLMNMTEFKNDGLFLGFISNCKGSPILGNISN
jgi:hypothetical protein